MKIVIIEDEKLVAEQLGRLIHALDSSIEILAVLSNIKAAVKWFGENPQPDLAFMDIQLSDGISFEIFEQAKIECPVIFTTAYNEYALRAFKVNSIDYLVKPVDQADLKKALEKFHALRKSAAPADQDIRELLKNIASSSGNSSYKQRFLVQYRNHYQPVESSQIAFIVRDQLIYLHTFKNEKYILDYNSLEEVEDLLDPKYFFRANRQYIIHLDATENFKNDYTGKISAKLISPFNIIIDISREKAKAFKAWLEK